ncbi:MAG: glycosyltransferase family 4 protein [Desulfosarcina sp.]|nr:glycosyltransferase family 4 protein [Desulfobacterales bacterium]
MRIAYYMPFKPLGHPNPSGDLVIGSSLFRFLRQRGHRIRLVSRLRSRWFYWKPWLWLRFLFETAKVLHEYRLDSPDLWLTYHSYYKAPDVLGAVCTRIRPIPYFIFQGVYSTKRRRHWQTRMGFLLNRWILCRADGVFTNKRNDEINLKRLLPPDRVHYVAPGIDLRLFKHDPAARRALRAQWRCGHDPVVLATAMFRPGVKTEGLERVIRACHGLRRKGRQFHLVICGQGSSGPYLRGLADQLLEDRVIFTGKVVRAKMNQIYSAADLFTFPGIREGLGMVYLEAQACGLPVVAYDRWGASEVVVNGQTGLLCTPDEPNAFERALDTFILDGELRRRMGEAAHTHVNTHHDQTLNYRQFEAMLKRMVAGKR